MFSFINAFREILTSQVVHKGFIDRCCYYIQYHIIKCFRKYSRVYNDILIFNFTKFKQTWILFKMLMTCSHLILSFKLLGLKVIFYKQFTYFSEKCLKKRISKCSYELLFENWILERISLAVAVMHVSFI